MLFNGGKRRKVSLKEALFHGFASGGELYLPQDLPRFTSDQLDRFRSLSFAEIAFEIGKKLFPEIKDLSSRIQDAFDFPIPLISFSESLHSLELFHGPTHSFKDYGARMLARLVHALKDPDEELTVLVATSGDTGSAVGQAFYDLPGIRVFILYPKGNVTPSQEKQITTIGKNVKAIEVEGGFEACQQLLKEACLDPELAPVTTGNSINIGRLLSHTFYYFYAWSRLKNSGPVYISVPCGNFGHLVSGILAKRMGLPVARFIAATNINDVVPLFLRSGVFLPHPSYRTMAVSMDVGNPSNFPRLLELYQSSLEEMRRDLIGTSFTDQEVARGIIEVYESSGYLLDPHSAISYMGLKKFMEVEKDQIPGIFFCTAHPAKFREFLEPLINQMIPLPETLQISKPKEAIISPPKYEIFKQILIKNLNTAAALRKKATISP
ncbi:MAG: threonine synthase [Chlamydiales bacterium]|nr:threonine synthase [Chlamydiales bacterium]